MISPRKTHPRTEANTTPKIIMSTEASSVVLFCCERRLRHGRRRAEQHGIVNDEPKFRLRIARVTLLPKTRILRLETKTLQRTFGGTILYPNIQLSPIR